MGSEGVGLRQGEGEGEVVELREGVRLQTPGTSSGSLAFHGTDWEAWRESWEPHKAKADLQRSVSDRFFRE